MSDKTLPIRGDDEMSALDIDAAIAALLDADDEPSLILETPPDTGVKKSPVSIADLLEDLGVLSPEQVAVAQGQARREKLSLSTVLVRDGLVQSRYLADVTAIHLGLRTIDLRSQAIDQKITALVSEEVSRRNIVLAIERADDGRVVVAMTDPTDFRLLQDLTARVGGPIEPVVAMSEDILEHIDITYRLMGRDQETPTDESDITSADQGRLTAQRLREAPPAELIDLILYQAIHDRASDIHIDPSEGRLRIRFRIDGILHDSMNLPPEMLPMLISRLKIMSGMNIAERRRPQDGQFTADIQGRKVDVRAAISSTVDGEMAVLRLLDKTFTLIGLEELGMNQHTLQEYRRLLRLPYGMVVVCGPTGAGKSTTLYASILNVNRMEQNVISLEDPVEYQIADTNQMQVNPEAGVTFATQLRSILRLDPDVILVGEIRDEETASIAAQAALTGHLVLTSLHANDAVSALLRLRDLGLPPYLIASSVAGIISQRMVRVVCNSCRELMPRPVAEQEAYSDEMVEPREQFVYGAGCNTCAHTGYRGRSGVFELLTMSDAVRQLFLQDAPRHELVDQVVKEGMIPLRRDGMVKVREGDTTPYEVMRVLFSLD